MGDALPRRLSVSLAGSSFAPVLPVHEARQEEGRRRRLSQANQTRGQWELQPLRTSFEGQEWSDLSEEGGQEEGEEGMTRKKEAKKINPRTSSLRQTRPGSGSSGISPVSNGHLPEGEMNGSFRERVGKQPHSIDIDGSSERQTARLMGRSSFSLDHAPPLSPTSASKEKGEFGGQAEGSKGFFELPEQDRTEFLTPGIVVLPPRDTRWGLAGGSVSRSYSRATLSYGQNRHLLPSLLPLLPQTPLEPHRRRSLERESRQKKKLDPTHSDYIRLRDVVARSQGGEHDGAGGRERWSGCVGIYGLVV